jgi:choline dehydrogenase-like flavoprotein
VFIDFREVASGTEITADVCIIGAGAAGITIARALGGEGRDIVLIESGGLDFDTPTQQLYAGDSVGRYYAVPETFCRMRYFGGSTNHWAGHCGPLDPLDFAVRSWIPHSGWPIGRSDLDAWYVQAQDICELGPFAYDAASWSNAERRFHEFLPSKLDHCFWQFSPPTRFGQHYREELANAPNIRVYLFANAVDIETDPGARTVQRVQLRTLTGGSGTVRASRYVLALGGIENPRLLLASDRVQPAGVGNDRDLVGRFFMEHPHVRSGTVLARDPSALLFPAFSAGRAAGQTLAAEFWQDGVHLNAGMKPSPQAQEREQILNAGIVLHSSDQFTGYDALRSIASRVRRGRWPGPLGRHLWRTISDFDQTARGLWSKVRRREYQRPKEVVLFNRSEQAPNPDSRVTLGHERDALGMRRVRVDWRLSAVDRRTVRRCALLIGEEMGRLDLGRVRLNGWLRDADDDTAWPEPEMRGGCHHMGTTRMAGDPAHGVVDANCRVHGLSNLYIAGSSVFPTAGFMNPTLTIIALALRLADHLATAPAASD